jgi:hypothetical protein
VNPAHPSVPVPLAELLVPDDVVGLPRVKGSPDGEVDLYEAALADPDPATALARLRGHGFVAGALRSWSDGDSIIEMTLHRLATDRDAELAALEHAHGVMASAGTRFDFDPGPATFGASVIDAAPGPDGPFIAHIVIRHAGPVVMLVLGGAAGYPA